MRNARSRGTGGGGGGGETDLHAAARSGDLTTVKSILSSNPLAVNNRDKHSRTPLHLAAWAGQTEVASYLCEHKADVGAAAMDDMGAIHFAAQKGHLEVVRSLLSSGVSTKSSTRKGQTPLHYAAQGSYLDLVKYLVKKGASITAKTKAGKTPADLASNEEIRTFLEKSAQSAVDGATKGESKVEKPSTTTQPDGNSASASCKSTPPDHDGQTEDETGKRKGEQDATDEAPKEPKRARVALNHLLTEDDTDDS